jgi:hypothetical protein
MRPEKFILDLSPPIPTTLSYSFNPPRLPLPLLLPLSPSSEPVIIPLNERIFKSSLL